MSLILEDVLRFSIIYSFEILRDSVSDVIDDCLPPKDQRKAKLWQVTEQNDSDSGWEDSEGRPAKNWKFCAVLNWREFCDFCESTDLFMEDVETMGSLGTPGFGFGWAPAMSFRSDAYSAYQNAYVTPWIDLETRYSWDTMRQWMLELFNGSECFSDLVDRQDLLDDVLPNREAINQTHLFSESAE